MPNSPYNFYDNEYIQSAMGQEPSPQLDFHMQNRIPHHVYYAETFGDRTREAPLYYGGASKASIRYDDAYVSTAGVNTAFESAFSSVGSITGAVIGAGMTSKMGGWGALPGAIVGGELFRRAGSLVGSTIGAAYQDELNSANYIYQSTRGSAGGGLGWNDSISAAHSLRSWSSSSNAISNITGGAEGLSDLIGDLTGAGAFSEVSSADEYISRVKSEIGALRQLQSRLKASKEEILSFMGESYGMGISASDITGGLLSRGVLETGAAMGFESTQLAQAGLSAGGLMAREGINASNAFSAGVTSLVHGQALYNTLGAQDQRLIALGGGVEAMAAGNIRHGMDFMQSDVGQMSLAAMVAGGLSPGDMTGLTWGGIQEAGVDVFMDPLTRARWTGSQRELAGAVNPLTMRHLEMYRNARAAQDYFGFSPEQQLDRPAYIGYLVGQRGYTQQSAAEEWLQMGMSAGEYTASLAEGARYAPADIASRPGPFAARMGYLGDDVGEVLHSVGGFLTREPMSMWRQGGGLALAGVSAVARFPGNWWDRNVSHSRPVTLSTASMERREAQEAAIESGESLRSVLSYNGDISGITAGEDSSDWLRGALPRGVSGVRFGAYYGPMFSDSLSPAQVAVAAQQRLGSAGEDWVKKAIGRGDVTAEHFNTPESFSARINLIEQVATGTAAGYTGAPTDEQLSGLSAAGLGGLAYPDAVAAGAVALGGIPIEDMAAMMPTAAGMLGGDAAGLVKASRPYGTTLYRSLTGPAALIEALQTGEKRLKGEIEDAASEYGLGWGSTITSLASMRYLAAIGNVYGDRFTAAEVNDRKVFDALNNEWGVTWDQFNSGAYAAIRGQYGDFREGEAERIDKYNMVLDTQTAEGGFSNLSRDALSIGTFRQIRTAYDESLGGASSGIRKILKDAKIEQSLDAYINDPSVKTYETYVSSITRASEMTKGNRAQELELGYVIGGSLLGTLDYGVTREAYFANMSVGNVGGAPTERNAATRWVVGSHSSRQLNELDATGAVHSQEMLRLMNATNLIMNPDAGREDLTLEDLPSFFSTDSAGKSTAQDLIRNGLLIEIRDRLGIPRGDYRHE